MKLAGTPSGSLPAGDLRTLPCHLAEYDGLDGFFCARLVKREGIVRLEDLRLAGCSISLLPNDMRLLRWQFPHGSDPLCA